jgi:hypothetical protein
MPWNGTILYVAALDENGAICGTARRIAGGPAESIFQPEWSPDSADLIFVSDRSGWWNLYGYTLATGALRPIAPRAAEFGQPQRNFGMATYAFAGPHHIVCAYSEAGLGHLAVVDLAAGSLCSIDTPFTQFASLGASAGRSQCGRLRQGKAGTYR